MYPFFDYVTFWNWTVVINIEALAKALLHNNFLLLDCERTMLSCPVKHCDKRRQPRSSTPPPLRLLPVPKTRFHSATPVTYYKDAIINP